MIHQNHLGDLNFIEALKIQKKMKLDFEAVIKGYKNVLTEEFNFYLKLGHSEN